MQFRHIDAITSSAARACAPRSTSAGSSVERAADRAAPRGAARADRDDCDAIVIAGGHVASLLNRLALFDMLALAAGKPIIAWSAGAMVLTERIVLFHDYPPYGSDIAQVLDAGFGLAPGVVVLPDPRRRINLDDARPASSASRGAWRRRRASRWITARALVFERRHGHARARRSRSTTTGDVERDWDGCAEPVRTPYLRGVHV